MSRLFGTDGVRGLANGLLTAELALQLAQAAAVVLGHDRNTTGKLPIAVVAGVGLTAVVSAILLLPVTRAYSGAVDAAARSPRAIAVLPCV